MLDNLIDSSCFIEEDVDKTVKELINHIDPKKQYVFQYFYSVCDISFIRNVIYTSFEKYPLEYKYLDVLINRSISSSKLIPNNKKEIYIEVILFEVIQKYFELIKTMSEDEGIKKIRNIINLTYEFTNLRDFEKFFSLLIKGDNIPNTILNDKDIIYKFSIQKNGLSTILNLIKKYNLYIADEIIVEFDIMELYTFRDCELSDLNNLLKKNSFRIISEYVKKNILDDTQLKHLKKKLKNSSVHLHSLRIFCSRINSFIFLLKLFNLNLRRCLGDESIEKIYDMLVENKRYIPLELIKCPKINWVIYENIEYNDIPNNMKPFWIDHWRNKIKTDFPKDRIVYFYEDIIYNEDLKKIYTDIQNSIEYDVNSENYERAKNHFIKSIN